MPRTSYSRRTLLATALTAPAAVRFSSLAGQEPQSEAKPRRKELLGQYEIWDAHGHMTGFSGTVEQRIDKILEFADRMHVRKLMMCMGLRFHYDPLPEQFVQDNTDVLKAVRHGKGRILGFVYLNPKHVEIGSLRFFIIVREPVFLGGAPRPPRPPFLGEGLPPPTPPWEVWVARVHPPRFKCSIQTKLMLASLAF